MFIPSEAATLRAVNLSKTFKKREVVRSVSFHVTAGEAVGLLGPNGAGKTTSFYMVVGLLRPGSGRVYLGGDDITDLPMHRRARKGIGYLPQNVSIFRKLSVRDNLLAIMGVVGIAAAEREQRCAELMDKFQISHIAGSLGAALSGGERRRVEIARSLIIHPKFLLLDEPFAGVDPVTVSEIQTVISGLCREGLGVLITDHNVRETLGSCHRAYVLADGQIIAHGSDREISDNPEVRRRYLGEKFKM